MESRKRKIIILVSAVIVICILGMGYYGYQFAKQSPKKEVMTKVDNLKKNINTVSVPKDKIKTIKCDNDVISLSDENIVYMQGASFLKVTDRKTNKETDIEDFNLNKTCMNICSNGKYVVVPEDVTDINKSENKESDRLVIYNIKNGKKTTLNQDDIVGSYKDKFKNTGSHIYPCMRIKDNKLIYSILAVDGLDIMSYDLESGKTEEVFMSSSTDHDLWTMHSFDIDLNKGYMIIEESKTNGDGVTSYSLVLLDIKNRKKTLLAKSSKEISTSMQYPDVAFQIKDKIHVYNIEKKKDDILIPCGDNASNVDIKDDYILWNDKKLSIYSMKDKKVYEIDNGWFKDDPNGNGVKRIDNDLLYWKDNDSVRYINMSNLEK